MKAMQLKNHILSQIEKSGTHYGSFEVIKDGELLAISWDDVDCDGNIDAHCEWVSLKDIEEAITQAEDETPFELSEAFVMGVVQILTLGDWMY
jgi:hypothetical protein